jgi:hypothetical protein
LIIFLISAYLQLSAQHKYTDCKSMHDKIEQLSKDHQQLCSSRSLVKTGGGREIWRLSIGIRIYLVTGMLMSNGL